MDDIQKKQNEALTILVQAVEKGQRAGAYTLDEAALINAAVKIFQPTPEAPADKPIEKENDSKDIKK